ncbi:hypothetical protein Dimus_036018 [Dionaea muscipula]
MGTSFQKERIGPYEIFVKEFYAKMTVIYLKKKDVVKSKVRGVEVEFDHEKLATILGIPGNNGICEYVKDVWEESKYIKPLEITRSSSRRRGTSAAGVDPSGPTSRDADFLKFQAEFERKRANRFRDELEKAKARMPNF